MPCIKIPTDNGFMILCGPRQRGPRQRGPRCQFPECSNERSFDCDFPLRPGKTCNRGFCGFHGRKVGYDQDHCWKHARHAAAQQRSLI